MPVHSVRSDPLVRGFRCGGAFLTCFLGSGHLGGPVFLAVAVLILFTATGSRFVSAGAWFLARLDAVGAIFIVW